MLESLLIAEIFRNATLNIGFKDRGFGWQAEPIAECGKTLRKIVKYAPSHVGRTDDQLMDVVDGVMRKFYPHHARWDNPHLQKLLLEKAKQLDKVAKDEPVEKEVLEKLFRFCEEMWIALSAFKARR